MKPYRAESISAVRGAFYLHHTWISKLNRLGTFAISGFDLGSTCENSQPISFSDESVLQIFNIVCVSTMQAEAAMLDSDTFLASLREISSPKLFHVSTRVPGWEPLKICISLNFIPGIFFLLDFWIFLGLQQIFLRYTKKKITEFFIDNFLLW